MGQAFIALGGQRHHFYAEIAEVRAAYVQCFFNIFHSGHPRILAGYEQEVFERGELLDSAAFVFDLFRGENYAIECVVAVEAAVDA